MRPGRLWRCGLLVRTLEVMSTDDTEPCPECASKNTRGISYGYPEEDTMEAARRGEIELGGCIVTGNDPDWHCADCKHEWTSKEPAEEE